jgi:hypothetical protein
MNRHLPASGALMVGVVALFVACPAIAADPTLTLASQIERRYSKPAELTAEEAPLVKSSTEFTQFAGLASKGRRLNAPESRPVRLDVDAKLGEREPTLVESLIADGFPTGVRRFTVEQGPPANHTVSYAPPIYHRAPQAPEADSRFVSGPRLVAIDGVAMRFRDEQPMVFGGMTFVR